MKNVLVQDLGGSEEEANGKAIYTWKKDDIAYLYCYFTNVFLTVKFTGEKWLSGNKWGRRKIYKYEILETTSQDRPSSTIGYISHDEEDSFYTEKNDIIGKAIRYIDNERIAALEQYDKKIIEINKYKNV